MEQAHLLFDPSTLEERFLWQRWDLEKDTLRPVKYLGLSKLRGEVIGVLEVSNHPQDGDLHIGPAI